MQAYGKIVGWIIGGLLQVTLYAQQIHPMETQFFINPYLANPALAGMLPQELVVNATYNSQWDRIPGSPTNMAFTADVQPSSRVGLGLNFISQKAGLLKQTHVSFSYAYHIPLSDQEEEYVHMGFSTGISKSLVDYNRLVGDASDPIVIGYNDRVVTWTVDAGIAYSKNGFMVQLAAPNLNRTMNQKKEGLSDYPVFYAAVNYEMQVSDEIMVNPKLAFQGIQNYDNIIGMGVQIQFKDPFSLSAIYHSNHSFGFGASYDFQNKWQLVCIYSTATKSMKGLANGIFEMGLRFRFSNLDKENR